MTSLQGRHDEGQLAALVGLREHEALRDSIDGAADAADGNPDVGAEEGPRQLLDLGREGRGEEESLPRL